MQQAIYYDNRENTIHLWDDKLGYVKESFDKYAYGYQIVNNKTAKGELKYTEYKTLYGHNAEKMYPSQYGRNIEENSELFETDVEHTTRYLIDNYLDDNEVSENFNILFYDIETEMVERKIDVHNVPNRMTSIAVHYTLSGYRAVYVVGSGASTKKKTEHGDCDVLFYSTEKEMLLAFLTTYELQKPHCLSGWNIQSFDTPYLYNRLRVLFGKITASRLSPIQKIRYNRESQTVNIAGVSIFDYMVLYKKFTNEPRSSYSLDNISLIELNRGKIVYDGTLDDLYRDDIDKFIDYNLNDIDLVLELDKKINFIGLSRMVCHLCHVSYDAIIHSSKYIDGAILTFLRKQKVVAPNTFKFTKMFTSTNLYKGSTKLFVSVKIDDRLPLQGLLKIQVSKSKVIEVEYDNYSGNCFMLSDAMTQDVVVNTYVNVAYVGAYVKVPIPGLYEWLFSIDATSLYPSIIRTLKISPESKVGKIVEWRDFTLTKQFINDGNVKMLSNSDNTFDYLPDDVKLTFENKNKETIVVDKQKFRQIMSENDLAIASNGVMYAKNRINAIPNILTEWFNLRLSYRALAKEGTKSGDNDKYEYYNNRQQVIKILLNSVYGVLGMPGFRFYDLDNAEAITLTGQEVIKFTSKLIYNYYKKQFNDPVDPVVYGDTDSAYIQIHKSVYENKTDESIIDYSEFICDLANKGLNLFSKFGLNTTDSVLEFKREKVCRSALFLAKKRYGLHVIDSEGKRVDNISVTGIDIKRSSYPKYFVTGLTDVLLGILKLNKKEDIDKIVLKLEKDISTVPAIDICKTSSVKDLESYESKTTNVTFEKGVTAWGKASIRYNFLLDRFKCDNKFAPILPSEKIKWCYLVENEYGFDNMALKGDGNPPEILKFVDDYIDRQKMFDKELKTKVVNFYDVMKWSYPSKYKEAADKYF